MEIVFRNKKVKMLLLLLFAVLLTISFMPVNKVYAATNFSVSYAGEAVNISQNPSYESWTVGNFIANTYHPTINLATKDVSIQFTWTGSVGNTLVSVDGGTFMSTDTVGLTDKVYFQDYKQVGTQVIKTIVLKNLSVGAHKITVRALPISGTTVLTDYTNVVLNY